VLKSLSDKVEGGLKGSQSASPLGRSCQSCNFSQHYQIKLCIWSGYMQFVESVAYEEGEASVNPFIISVFLHKPRIPF